MHIQMEYDPVRKNYSIGLIEAKSLEEYVGKS